MLSETTVRCLACWFWKAIGSICWWLLFLPKWGQPTSKSPSSTGHSSRGSGQASALVLSRVVWDCPGVGALPVGNHTGGLRRVSLMLSEMWLRGIYVRMPPNCALGLGGYRALSKAAGLFPWYSELFCFSWCCHNSPKCLPWVQTGHLTYHDLGSCLSINAMVGNVLRWSVFSHFMRKVLEPC